MPAEKKPVLVVVNLSLTKDGLSGGDARLRAMLQRWRHKAEIWCVTCPAGRENMASWDVPARFVVSSGFPEGVRTLNTMLATLCNMWFALSMTFGRLKRVPPPDIIYVHADFLYEVWVGTRLKRLHPNARLVVMSQYSYREGYQKLHSFAQFLMYLLQSLGFKLLARYADLVLFLTTVTGDIETADLKKAGIDEERIHRILNGIEVEEIRVSPDIKKDFDACVIGIRRRKGLEDIAEIWEGVCRARPGSRLYILGEVVAGDRAVLERDITKRGLSGAIVLGGHFSAPELYSQIQRATLCLSPTHHESFGIAVCEAMACGLPVVSYDIPNYRRLHQDKIVAAPCYDRDAFARQIVELLGNNSRTMALSEQVRVHARTFDNGEIAESEWRIMMACQSKRP